MGVILLSFVGLKMTSVSKLAPQCLHDVTGIEITEHYYQTAVARLQAMENLITKRGDEWDITSDEVLQAVMAKWQELDLAQVAAGVKEAMDAGTEDAVDMPVDGENE